MHSYERWALRIDEVNQVVGRIFAWAALAMVLVQFAVVIARYVFAIGSIPVQESILYYHSFLFLLGAGYTLRRDGHVRVDVFYREASPSKKAMIDLFGVVFLLTPVCIATWWFGWSFAVHSIEILEGSKEPLGLHLIYILKTIILPFALLVFIQGIALALRSLLVIKGYAETNLPAEVAAEKGH